MIKRTIPAFIFAAALVFGADASAKADITSTIGEFDEPFSFGGSTTTLGNFLFTIPAGLTVRSATISGTFGNEDVPGTTNVTALSDYFVDNGTIEVAACDNFTDPCSAGGPNDAPVAWSYTFSSADLTNLAGEFASGNVDFSVAQNFLGAVETGPITLDIVPTPEPTVFFPLLFGLAGLPLLRRFRKA